MKVAFWIFISCFLFSMLFIAPFLEAQKNCVPVIYDPPYNVATQQLAEANMRAEAAEKRTKEVMQNAETLKARLVEALSNACQGVDVTRKDVEAILALRGTGTNDDDVDQMVGHVLEEQALKQLEADTERRKRLVLVYPLWGDVLQELQTQLKQLAPECGEQPNEVKLPSLDEIVRAGNDPVMITVRAGTNCQWECQCGFTGANAQMEMTCSGKDSRPGRLIFRRSGEMFETRLASSDVPVISTNCPITGIAECDALVERCVRLLLKTQRNALR